MNRRQLLIGVAATAIAPALPVRRGMFRDRVIGPQSIIASMIGPPNLNVTFEEFVQLACRIKLEPFQVELAQATLDGRIKRSVSRVR